MPRPLGARHQGVRRRAGQPPETTSYPRPAHDIPVVVGGNGERRTLAIAARLGDACNLPSDTEVLTHKLAVLDRHLADAGRTRDDVAVTVLDLPVVGRDRDDAWARVERLRGRTPAAAFARRTHAGTAAQHRARYDELRELGRQHGLRRACAAWSRPDDVARRSPGRLTRYLSSALDRPSTRRATISCWICWVPSKMSRIFESRAHFSSSSPSL